MLLDHPKPAKQGLAAAAEKFWQNFEMPDSVNSTLAETSDSSCRDFRLRGAGFLFSLQSLGMTKAWTSARGTSPDESVCVDGWRTRANNCRDIQQHTARAAASRASRASATSYLLASVQAGLIALSPDRKRSTGSHRVQKVEAPLSTPALAPQP